jgi:hypothetical protein
MFYAGDFSGQEISPTKNFSNLSRFLDLNARY